MSKEEIKEFILKKYPNIEFNNEMFLRQEVIDDFELYVIINNLLKLNKKEAFDLYMYIYEYGNFNYIKDMIKYIAVNNIDYFKGEDESKFIDLNIIKEYTRLYQCKNFTPQELEELEKTNIENNKDKNKFIDFDINYYNELIMIQKLYREGKIKYNDIINFIEFTIKILNIEITKEVGNFEKNYENYIKEIMSHLLIGNISPMQLYDCLNNDQSIKNLIIVSKLEKRVPKIINAPIEVLMSIKGKQIKNTYKEFQNLKGMNKIKKEFNKEEILTIITKMSLLIGTDNVNNIFRHLPQDDEYNSKIIRLFYSIINIDLSSVKAENNQILYNKDFINFFIGNNLSEPTSLLNLIYEGRTTLSDKIETIYTYWNLLDERHKFQPLKTKLAFLEEVFSNSMVVLNPDEYLLEGKIINSYYDNKKFQHTSNLNLIEQIREEYSKMKHNYQKTIPYVSGEYEEYKYETIRANDPILFEMGAISDCCFKIGGDAESFVKYCAHDKNGRVLVIKNKKGNIVAMVPMVRNGNLILCNSIESTMVRNKEFMSKMFNILAEAGNKMIDISSKKELEKDSLKGVLVGSYKNEISELGNYQYISYGEIDDSCINPLDNTIYANMGGIRLRKLYHYLNSLP